MTTDDLQKMHGNLFAANEIWQRPKFHVADVCAITGATPKALEHFVSPKRNLVRLVGQFANPGTGRRRTFTGGQVLMIAAAYAMTRIGFPQRWVRTLADTIERRALNRAIPGLLRPGLMIATYPTKDGTDWVFQHVYEGMEEEPVLPVAIHLLDVDRLIDEVKTQLQAIIAGEEIPDFSVPDPEPQRNPYSPAVNFFRDWEKSKSGRWIYVGLTEEETDELLAMQGIEIHGDDLEYVAEREGKRGRFTELLRKHELARSERIGANLEANDG